METFKPGLEPFGPAATQLYAYTERPDILVRHMGTEPGKAFETALEARRLHTELTQDFGIDVVSYSAVINGENSYACVVKRIDGTSFLKTPGEDEEIIREDLTEEQYEAAKVLFKKQYDYVTTKVANKEIYLLDVIGLYQYMYDTDGKWVLVDIDPLCSQKDNRPSYPIRLEEELLILCHLAQTAGKLFESEPQVLAEWKQRARELLNLVLNTNGLSADENACSRTLEVAFSEDYWAQLNDSWEDGVLSQFLKQYRKLYAGGS